MAKWQRREVEPEPLPEERERVVRKVMKLIADTRIVTAKPSGERIVIEPGDAVDDKAIAPEDLKDILSNGCASQRWVEVPA